MYILAMETIDFSMDACFNLFWTLWPTMFVRFNLVWVLGDKLIGVRFLGTGPVVATVLAMLSTVVSWLGFYRP